MTQTNWKMRATPLKLICHGIIFTNLFFGLAQAQSCNESITRSTPDARYITSGNEVTDSLSQLTWKRCAEGQIWNAVDSRCVGNAISMTWQQALNRASSDWRLPNIKELLSLVENACNSPAINQTVFPETPPLFFWTASPYLSNAKAWVVSFASGDDQAESKSNGWAVRLVKDAN